MNLYFTDAIGFSKPGKAYIRSVSVDEAIQKTMEFLSQYPHYQLFKTLMVVGEESDEVDFVIRMVAVPYKPVGHSTPDIDMFDCGGINEDPAIGNGLYIN